MGACELHDIGQLTPREAFGIGIRKLSVALIRRGIGGGDNPTMISLFVAMEADMTCRNNWLVSTIWKRCDGHTERKVKGTSG